MSDSKYSVMWLDRKPLVFACSGCSNAGLLADHVAREMNRRGVAEMSCLAGVGAGKSQFLKKLDRRQVWAIDGCPIECCRGVFEKTGRKVDRHLRLRDCGVQKNGPLPSPDAFAELVGRCIQEAQSPRTGNSPSTEDQVAGG